MSRRNGIGKGENSHLFFFSFNNKANLVLNFTNSEIWLFVALVNFFTQWSIITFEEKKEK